MSEKVNIVSLLKDRQREMKALVHTHTYTHTKIATSFHRILSLHAALGARKHSRICNISFFVTDSVWVLK